MNLLNMHKILFRKSNIHPDTNGISIVNKQYNGNWTIASLIENGT
jgi:hypothetical protein